MMIVLQKFQPQPPILLQRFGLERELAAVRTNNLPAIPAIIGPPGPKGADGIEGPVGPSLSDGQKGEIIVSGNIWEINIIGLQTAS